MTRVSVIVPNYNHGRFLERRLQSILDQSHQDFEVIYLDDASTDNSDDVFSRFAGDRRVRAIRNVCNSGSAFKQWNRGLREAQGEYVWIAESDDYADPRFLETLLERLQRYPSAGIAYCQSECVDEEGGPLGIMEHRWNRFEPGRWDSDFFNDGCDELARYMVRACTVCNVSAALLRRQICEEVGGADESFRCTGDWDMYARMLGVSNIVFVAQPLNFWRTHSGTIRTETEKNLAIIEESYRVIEGIMNAVPVPDDVLEDSLDGIAEWWLRLRGERRLWDRRDLAAYRVGVSVDGILRRRLARKTASKAYWSMRVRLGALRRQILGGPSCGEEKRS